MKNRNRHQRKWRQRHRLSFGRPLNQSLLAYSIFIVIANIICLISEISDVLSLIIHLPRSDYNQFKFYVSYTTTRVGLCPTVRLLPAAPVLSRFFEDVMSFPIFPRWHFSKLSESFDPAVYIRQLWYDFASHPFDNPSDTVIFCGWDCCIRYSDLIDAYSPSTTAYRRQEYTQTKPTNNKYLCQQLL